MREQQHVARTRTPHTQFLRIALAPVGERNISSTGVLSADRPGGLAMPDETNLRKSAAHVRGAFCPAPLPQHVQLRISGMRSPCVSICWRPSIGCRPEHLIISRRSSAR